jgi:leucyl-tRNA synthetase
MEMSVDTIISIATLLLGGGGGAFFTWRWQRSKAKAEAKQAEASAAKELQDMYQQMIQDAKTDREDRRQQNEELRAERDHYKNERNEYREQMSKLTDEFRDFRRKSEDDMDALKRTQARQGRMIEAMRPFMCGDLKCPSRQRVTTLDAEALERTIHINEEQKDIEPYNGD